MSAQNSSAEVAMFSNASLRWEMRVAKSHPMCSALNVKSSSLYR
jgi:hypothetical protein